VQLFVANGLMGLFLWFFAGPMSDWLNLSWEWRAEHLCLLLAGAIAIYFVVLFVSGVRVAQFKLKQE
jgi:putative peptidoglycan lipid II flippase